MCYGHRQSESLEPLNNSPASRTANENAMVVEDLRGRLAETEARLARARAREAKLNRQLEEMKRFVAVMEIVENYLKRRFRKQQEHSAQLFSGIPKK